MDNPSSPASLATPSMLGRGGEPTPVSAYLHERLKERRDQVNTGKLSTSHDRDESVTQDDTPSPRVMQPQRTSSLQHGASTDRGGRTSAPFGLREMERHTDKILKDNFTLKLELHHRDETIARMREQLENLDETVKRVQALETANKELFEVNEQLLNELEGRDAAVGEAVDMITNLEDQVMILSQKRRSLESRPSTSQADTGYCSATSIFSEKRSRSSSRDSNKAKTLGMVSQSAINLPISQSFQEMTPIHSLSEIDENTPTADTKMPSTETRARKRVPAFFAQDNNSQSALRSAYLTGGDRLSKIRNRASLISISSQHCDDRDSGFAPSPPSPNLTEISELGSVFYNQHESPANALECATFEAPTTRRPSTTIPPSALLPDQQPILMQTDLSPPLQLGRSLSAARQTSLRESRRTRHPSRHSDIPTSVRAPSPSPQTPLPKSAHLPLPNSQNHQLHDSSTLRPPHSPPPTRSSTSSAPSSLADPHGPMRYAGFPTGQSIFAGTPSRFRAGATPPDPVATNLLFDGDGIENFARSSSSSSSPIEHRQHHGHRSDASPHQPSRLHHQHRIKQSYATSQSQPRPAAPSIAQDSPKSARNTCTAPAATSQTPSPRNPAPDRGSVPPNKVLSTVVAPNALSGQAADELSRKNSRGRGGWAKGVLSRSGSRKGGSPLAGGVETSAENGHGILKSPEKEGREGRKKWPWL